VGALIRPFEPDDAPGVVELLRQLEPSWITTLGGLQHRLQKEPRRARRRSWVAADDNEIVGWSSASFKWAIQADDVASLDLKVRDDRRGEGIGTRLYGLAEAHLLERGARQLESWTDNDAGRRFLEQRGFVRERSERLWSLDPRTVDVGDLSRLETDRAREGFQLASLRQLEYRIDDVYPLWAEAVADMPAEEPESNISLEEWRQGELGHPDLSWEGSFVVLHGDRPVSLAWIEIDLEQGKAEHEMTGTLREFRRRGLARLAKMATIRWAAANGVQAMLTGNDSTNSDMLALNEHLGYRPLPRSDRYVKRL
jgi:GNAT superfamily N-acetyltransferase